MPATISSIRGARQGTFVVLEACLPERTARPIGVMLIDPETDRAWVRLRAQFDDLTDDTDVWDALADDLRAKAAENGAEALLKSLEDTLSNALRVGERQAVEVDAFTRAVERLYAEHVEEPPVKALPSAVEIEAE